MRDVIIIGGGASGQNAALMLGRYEQQFTLIRLLFLKLF
jgi:thioredoxin reductase